MDRLASMAIFARAVELGSFSAAGDALDMSSQLVGKHVRMLEQHLGVKLLNRTTRRQSLTAIGQAFYERAKNIIAEVDAAESLAAETRVTPRGLLRINAPVSFGTNTLARRLPEYMRQYPDVSVEMNLSNRFVDLIDEGYDAVFRVGELADSGLMARSLAPYQLVLCCSPDYLKNAPKLETPGDIENHECMTFAVSSTRYEWIFEGAGGPIVIPIKARLTIDNGEALRTAARAGMGLIFQPRDAIREDLEAGKLVEALPEFKAEARPFHILYAPDRRMTPKLRSFLDFATRHFG